MLQKRYDLLIHSLPHKINNHFFNKKEFFQFKLVPIVRTLEFQGMEIRRHHE